MYIISKEEWKIKEKKNTENIKENPEN